jgi:hypothetical protein
MKVKADYHSLKIIAAAIVLHLLCARLLFQACYSRHLNPRNTLCGDRHCDWMYDKVSLPGGRQGFPRSHTSGRGRGGSQVQVVWLQRTGTCLLSYECHQVPC